MDYIKEKIILKSFELFRKVGVKGITMDMISKELGISKKTLYEHFFSKEELIRRTFTEKLSLAVSELEKNSKNHNPVIHQFFFLLKNFTDIFFIKKDSLSLQLEKFYPEIYSEILNIQKQCIETLIENNITQGIKEGLYRSKINKDLTVDFFYQAEQFIYSEEVPPNKNALTYYLELLIRSIATKKGLKELEKLPKSIVG
ncbi:MAG: TetR/AcrR family transcriptional regulator [Flavobacteriaceae bacterium]|jgi:AcrR family transcriptional regulator|nr:TetR/AcrR family transcriptional regulator [Flavobacteriaceae bacterium]